MPKSQTLSVPDLAAIEAALAEANAEVAECEAHVERLQVDFARDRVAGRKVSPEALLDAQDAAKTLRAYIGGLERLLVDARAAELQAKVEEIEAAIACEQQKIVDSERELAEADEAERRSYVCGGPSARYTGSLTSIEAVAEYHERVVGHRNAMYAARSRISALEAERERANKLLASAAASGE